MPSENVTFTIYAPASVKAALEARAAKEGRSVSSVATRVLEAATKRWQANGPAGAQADEAKPEGKDPNGTSIVSPRVNGRAD